VSSPASGGSGNAVPSQASPPPSSGAGKPVTRPSASPAHLQPTGRASTGRPATPAANAGRAASTIALSRVLAPLGTRLTQLFDMLGVPGSAVLSSARARRDGTVLLLFSVLALGVLLVSSLTLLQLLRRLQSTCYEEPRT